MTGFWSVATEQASYSEAENKLLSSAGMSPLSYKLPTITVATTTGHPHQRRSHQILETLNVIIPE